MSTPEAWVGCDLDGCLAEYDGYSGPEHIGVVIPLMRERVLGWIAEGKTVKIFTARASIEGQVKLVQDWLEENGFPRLEVTNVKDMGMVELYDDRCTRIIMNTGVIFNEEKLATIQEEVQKERERVAIETHANKNKASMAESQKQIDKYYEATIGPYHSMFRKQGESTRPTAIEKVAQEELKRQLAALSPDKKNAPF
jgi:hypothetical protein